MRLFTDEPVSRELVHEIMAVARYAPSGTNTQPWNVYALAGAVKDAVCAEISADYESNGESKQREYDYYPTDWFEPYLGRRRTCGWGLYGALGITREDKHLMHEQRGRNYVFFGAPVGLIFTINRRLSTGSWLDVGMFLQNIMVAARARGLHTCAQASFANYPHIIRNHITIGDEEVVICGMALGYGDMQAPENVWRTEREDVDVFTRFLGFE